MSDDLRYGSIFSICAIIVAFALFPIMLCRNRRKKELKVTLDTHNENNTANMTQKQQQFEKM
jgi:hypothetical protein